MRNLSSRSSKADREKELEIQNRGPAQSVVIARALDRFDVWEVRITYASGATATPSRTSAEDWRGLAFHAKAAAGACGLPSYTDPTGTVVPVS